MAPLVIIALALMIGGLVLCVLAPKSGSALLTPLFWWVGLLLAILGLVLILAPVIAWIAAQLKAMFGV